MRVPRNEAGIIGKCLDAGAWGVIVPMVCSRAEAQAAMAACRYAPVGIRSYGPLRANYYAGFDYFERANDEVLCVVMVETRGAVADVEEIVSVPGVDAVYIGPADLSVTLGLPPGPDNSDAAFSAALDRVLDACRRHHVVPGIAGNASTAGKRLAQGFRLVEVASDAGLLAHGRGCSPGAGPARRWIGYQVRLSVMAAASADSRGLGATGNPRRWSVSRLARG